MIRPDVSNLTRSNDTPNMTPHKVAQRASSQTVWLAVDDPRVAQPVVRFSMLAAIVYITTPIIAVQTAPAWSQNSPT